MKTPKKTIERTSENAKAVAREVVATVGKGRKVNLGKIIRNHGYSDSVSESPKKVTQTLSYINEVSPLVDRMIEQRNLALARMNDTVGKAKFRDAVDAFDKITKNIQLITGKATTRVNIADLLDGIEKENNE